MSILFYISKTIEVTASKLCRNIYMQPCMYPKQKNYTKSKVKTKANTKKFKNDSLQPVLPVEAGTHNRFLAGKSNPLEFLDTHCKTVKAMGTYIRPDIGTEEEDTQQGKVKKQTPPPEKDNQ